MTLIDDLIVLREQCFAIAQADTAHNQRSYTRVGHSLHPLCGHCIPVSQAVLRLYGGHLVYGEVKYLGESIPHWWNCVEDTEYDLTSEVFMGDGLHGIPKDRLISHHTVDQDYLHYSRDRAKITKFWDRLTLHRKSG